MGRFLFVVLGLFVWSGTAWAEVTRERRVAVIIGNDRGLSDEVPLRYAGTDALKMQRALEDLGGFESSDIHTLIGSKADGLRSLLASLSRDSETPPSLLFFYYSGHGSGTHLHMDGTKLPVEELQRAIYQLKRRISVVLVDSCKSGVFTRAKGARPGPAYDIQMLQDPKTQGSIVITSSAEDEVSQESDKLEGSFFTHNWVRGLYGPADTNRDGLVSLEEAYQFAHYATIEQTIASRGGVQHPSYRFELSGQGNVVMSNLAKSTASVRVNPDRAGTYFVLDGAKQLVLTELVRTSDGFATLRLPPGNYRIRKREPHRFLVTDVEIAAGQNITLNDADMESVAYENRAKKGADAPFGIDNHGPVLSFNLRSGLNDQMSMTRGLRAGYRLGWRWLFIEPRFQFNHGSLRVLSEHLRHIELNFGASGGIKVDLGMVEFNLGGDGGLVLFDQEQSVRIQAGEIGGAAPFGLQGTGFVEAAVALWQNLRLRVRVDAGVMIFREGNDLTAAPLYGASFGVSYLFQQ